LSPSPTIRLLAARQLDSNENRSAYVGFSREERHSSPETARGVRELVSGVTRWKRYLDFILDAFYKGDLSSMEHSMLTVLRIGLYELLFTRQPDHAVLNEAVETAKKHVRPGAGGLANGILRNVLRKRDSLPEPDIATPAGMAVRFSHPEWMVERWLLRWGAEDTLAFLKHNNQRPKFGVRILSNREQVLEALHEAETEYEDSPYVDDFIRVRNTQALLRGGFIEAGDVLIQDEAAALVTRLSVPEKNSHVLDMCAAPGGKSVQLALALEESGSVVAADSNRKRLRLIDQNITRLGLTNVESVHADGTNPPDDWLEAFDTVLLDAPCTGMGVLAKRADMRWNREETDLARLSDLQTSLMDGASSCVKPGGVLIYSTCTVEPEENEMQVTTFLERNAEFELEPVSASIPSAMKTPEGMYLSLPFQTGVDGAFGAVLRKKK